MCFMLRLIWKGGKFVVSKKQISNDWFLEQNTNRNYYIRPTNTNADKMKRLSQ